MKRIIALILALCLTLANIFAMVACAPVVPEIPDIDNPGIVDPDDDGNNDDGNDSDNNDSPGNSQVTIISPEFESDGRLTKKLSEIDYVAVDIDGLCSDFAAVVEMIEANEASFEEQLEAVISLENCYIEFKTMMTLSEIYYYKNLSDATWSARYNFYSTERPRFSQSIEALYVAAARSPHVEAFESEYFGDGLDEEYLDGGKYTDEVVALMSSEAAIKNEYHLISEETVEITFGDKTDDYATIMGEINEKYSKGEIGYSIYYQYYTECFTKYKKARQALETDVYVRLVNIRRDIAKALNRDSYIDIAYEDMGYDYSPDEYIKFVEEVVASIIPVYDELTVGMTNSLRPGALDRVLLINNMYDVLLGIDERFANIYGYMLGNELYDIGMSSDSRFSGSFTAYITGNHSPFLFVTTEGFTNDYSTLAHEFGHFVDGYVNYGGTSSLELAEVCSQGLEFIVLSRLDSKLGEGAYKLLKQYMIMTSLETIIYQSMYALFEHYVYQLDSASINSETLDNLAKQVVEEVLGESDSIRVNFDAVNCSVMLVQHLVIAPFYVQSYSTSIIPSLEMYLDEENEVNSGLSKYHAIIYREEDYSFSEMIRMAELSSPFDKGTLSRIADGLYYNLIGRHFISSSPGSSNAA